jgi:transposase
MLPFDLLSQILGTTLVPPDLVFAPDLIVVALASCAGSAPCPICGQRSDRVHSRYRRVIADLPLCGRQLALILRLRKFLCPNAGCPRRIFCERVHGLAATHARSTTRLAQLQRMLGLALGGEPGSRLAGELAVPISGDTILRRVKAVPAEPETSYRFVGIDDFALRKGHTYGTILVDLQRGRVIDLFDGRDGAPVAAWLAFHSGIEIITRDRWAAYANACTAGAPKATQVADRFHLIGNIRELVERLFEQHASALDAVLEPPLAVAPEPCVATIATPPTPGIPSEQPLVTGAPTPPGGPDGLPAPANETPTPPPPRASHPQQQRQDRFDEVRRLRQTGKSVRQIARELRMSRQTVINYQRRERCPDWNPGTRRPTRLDGLQAKVDAFIREGGRTATVLYRALKDQGCRSSYDAVRRFLTRRLQAAGIAPARSSRGPPHLRRPSARQLSFEFVRRAEERSDEAVQRMGKVSPIPALCGPLALADELLAMTRCESKTALADWLGRAAVSASGSVQSFAETLRTEAAAVQTALSTSWSNGPVEGQVNRLKLIKRSMYGRAGLPLLRARVCAKS